jgi:rhombotail lipoprotein
MACRLFNLSCLFITVLSGCAELHPEYRQSFSSESLSSCINVVKDNVVRDSRLIENKRPLKLPASIAIVVIPGEGVPVTTLQQGAEKLKQQLIANPKYVGSVTVVPAEDTRPSISLQKIHELYDTDVAILLSYQQDIRNQQSGPAAFMDLTIIGYYFVPGVETLTSTIVEGKVIHIPSNAMIFRANGTDQRSRYSTSYGEKNTAGNESIEGILAATTDLGNSLSKTLKKFEDYDASRAVPLTLLLADDSKERGVSKSANDYWETVNTYKSSGGGSFNITLLLISLFVCFTARRQK